MPDLTGITAVKPMANTVTSKVTLGDTCAVGTSVYKDAADSKHKLADADTELEAQAVGVVMTAGVDTDETIIATSGAIELVGTTMTKGLSYYVSETAGAIMPEADLNTNKWICRLGTAESATQLNLNIEILGFQSA